MTTDDSVSDTKGTKTCYLSINNSWRSRSGFLVFGVPVLPRKVSS